MPPTAVTPAIPASQIVEVIPSVLGAGGNALQLLGLVLTENTRVPIGQVYSFPNDGDSVGDFFGDGSQENALATIYFNGFDNSQAKPASILFAQYNVAPVSAYLRGGNISGLSLTALQAISGTLGIVIDGTLQSGAVNLSSATSFSSAAQKIGDALGLASIPEVAVVVGAIAGSTLTVTTVNSGVLAVGDLIAGTGITAGTYISALGSGTGGTGTYTVVGTSSASSTTITVTQPQAIFTATISANTMTVSAVAEGTLAVGQIIEGASVTAGTYIQAFGSGTGGTGTYTLSAASTVGSGEQMVAYLPGVTYDSTSGAFVVTSSTTGTSSTITFGAGSVATSLMLTQATGAVLSQGAAAQTPGTGAPLTYMPGIIATTQNWLSFMTTFEPVDADKISFAQWTNNQGNRYMYCMWETNVLDTENNGPSLPVSTINAGSYSGIAMIYENPDVDTTGQIAAFVMGYAASLNFGQTNGRYTAAFRSQSGLAPQVTDGTIAAQLQAFGMDFYGDYTTADESFVWLYPGSISGEFLWIDSYVDQVWLTNQLQLALMTLLQNSSTIPYNAAGNALIQAACLDPINQAVTFGAIRAGVQLSMQQQAEVNNAAGFVIAPTLIQQGWYLLIGTATSQVRAARQSPPITLWYVDGQSVQQIVLNSIEVQ